MRIEREIKLNVTLDNEEIFIIEKTRQLLKNIEEKMTHEHCETIICRGEYGYDISDLRAIIDDLEAFKDISEIIN